MTMYYRAGCMLFVAAFCLGCSESDVLSPEVTPTTFNVAGAPTVEFRVPDMMCPQGCAVKTKEILSEQPGAKEVVVDFEAKTATVAIDTSKDAKPFDPQAAIAALVDYGFEHSTLKPAVAQ
jgi:copper chaperone CopZ